LWANPWWWPARSVGRYASSPGGAVRSRSPAAPPARSNPRPLLYADDKINVMYADRKIIVLIKDIWFHESDPDIETTAEDFWCAFVR
jgi:hypothetical protein